MTTEGPLIGTDVIAYFIRCADMSSTEATPHETTRIYARQPAPPPPSEPQDKGKHYGYNIDSSPRPPPPPPRPQLGLKAPPAPLEHMGWNSKQHFECTFEDQIEYTVSSDGP